MLEKSFENACNHFLANNDISQMYHVFNLTSYNDIDRYLKCLKKNLKIDFYDCYHRTARERNAPSIQIADHIPFSFADVESPLIYVVDSILSLKENRFWVAIRNISRDIAVDINGNICMLSEIIDS